MAQLGAARLGDVALHQGASVGIDVQRSASRSAMTSADALPRTFASRGARVGRAAAGGVSRPSATSARTRSSLGCTGGDDVGDRASTHRDPHLFTAFNRPQRLAQRRALDFAHQSRACGHHTADVVTRRDNARDNIHCVQPVQSVQGTSQFGKPRTGGLLHA